MNNLLKPEWHNFITQENISPVQAEAFMQYALLLQEWNKKINLTAIDEFSSIITDHFQDSLAIARFITFNRLRGIADVGSGAGFPGIPLAICYPELPVFLIEVNNKKISFLQEVIQRLGLAQVAICPLDWRTFLRTTAYTIDLFCARASLSMDELVRLFKPGCAYYNSFLVYWASRHWQLSSPEQPFFRKEESYSIKNKRRRFIFFATHELEFLKT